MSLQALNLWRHKVHCIFTSQILNLTQKFILHSLYNLMSIIMIYDTWMVMAAHRHGALTDLEKFDLVHEVELDVEH